MEQITLGHSDLSVSRICLGTMTFGAQTDEAEAHRIMDAALEAGINFFDTAEMYAVPPTRESFGKTETIIGNWFQQRPGARQRVVLASKIAGPSRNMDWIRNGASDLKTEDFKAACDDSLKRLGTDWIDVYQLHRPDPNVPIEESLSALNDLVRMGKIRAFGTSTFPAEHLVEAAWVADKNNFVPFSTEQPPYSIFVRWIERDLLPTCAKLNMGTLVWSPLNGGWLSGSYRKTTGQRNEGRAARTPARYDMSDPANQQKMDLVESLVGIADEIGVSLAHLAIAWVLHHPAVTSAIIGPRLMTHLTTLLGAEEISLSAETLDKIDALVAPGRTVMPDEARWETPALSRRNRRV